MRHIMGRHGVTRIALTGPWALAVGMICIGIATYMFMTSSALLTDGVATEAKVVDVDSHFSGGKRTFALTLAYTDQAGVTHNERTSYSTRNRWIRRGEHVAIRYNPRLPSEFAFDSWYGLWMMPAGFAAVGIAACLGFLVGPRRGQGPSSWTESHG